MGKLNRSHMTLTDYFNSNLNSKLTHYDALAGGGQWNPFTITQPRCLGLATKRLHRQSPTHQMRGNLLPVVICLPLSIHKSLLRPISVMRSSAHGAGNWRLTPIHTKREPTLPGHSVPCLCLCLPTGCLDSPTPHLSWVPMGSSAESKYVCIKVWRIQYIYIEILPMSIQSQRGPQQIISIINYVKIEYSIVDSLIIGLFISILKYWFIFNTNNESMAIPYKLNLIKCLLMIEIHD